ncbi:MAG: PAS domain S-box protein, partial [Bacteroidetes bacterium]|nr:PAS domain S-box protein [Bacteroidota bacterium]
ILAKQVVTTLALRSELMKLRKVQEESSDELMATFFKNAIDAVIVMDEKGVILQWNPKAEVIFGWKAEEAIGQYFHEIIIPERYREGHLKRMKMFGKDAILNKTIEIIALRKNTAEFDLALGISPTTIKGQQFFIGFANDITERKLVTQKLDNQKEFYENILNSLPTDIVVFDPNHKYIFVNPGAIKNDELRKYIIGKDDFEYAEYRGRDKSIAEKRREQFLEIQRESKEIRWEDSLKDPNGQTITHLRRLYPVFNDKDQLTMVIGFGIDITDRKMLEEKQVAYFDQVSAQNTQLIDFCNIVSHNLRAPLVNMSMLATFIEDCTDEIEQKILISKLRPVVDNLHATFNELVESIQIKQDLEVSSEVIALDDCMKRTLDGLEAEIANSGAVIETHFEVPIIKYPPKYLFSIFHNLVSNTLKYQSPDRKPLIKVSVKKDNDKVILSISDNGLGIDLTKHGANIFKIGKVFHRNANSKGFGLYMTKTHVEAMGGKIWVESTPEVGSTFFIEFKNQNI